MRKQFKPSVLLLFFSLCLTISSCCSTCGKASPKIGDLESARWELIELSNESVLGSEISLTFNAEKKLVSGKCPCNNFFGGYVLSDSKTSNIKFANMGSTMRMCPDTRVEDKFKALIATVTLIKMDGENLLFLNEGGELVAVLRKTAK